MISFQDFRQTDGTPIYLEIVRYIQQGLAAGTIQDGDELPSRRVVSALLAVNPNTVQRALAELEGTGLLHTQRTAGRTVTSDTALIAKTRQALAASLAQDFLAQAKALGLTREEILALLQQEE